MNISISVSNYNNLMKEKIGLTSSFSRTATVLTRREIWVTRLRSFRYFVEWVMILRDLYSLLERPMCWFIDTMRTTIFGAIRGVRGTTHDEIREEKSLEVDVKIIMERLGMVWEHADITWSKDITSLFDENEPSLDEVKGAFDVFDVKGDGFIDADELQFVLSKLGYLCISKSDCRRMIDEYDVDKDAKISSIEFFKLIEDGFQ